MTFSDYIRQRSASNTRDREALRDVFDMDLGGMDSWSSLLAHLVVNGAGPARIETARAVWLDYIRDCP